MKILYTTNNIPVQIIAVNILEIINSLIVIFNNIAVSIGSSGVVIILTSLYGISPVAIALAVL